jgi:exodeoxyribonuclease V alpha subunit
LLPDDEGDLVVKFQLAEGTTRKVSPNRIGAVQDAMAITVHRAQGSEFERVAIVVEPHVLRGLSKQLLYTAVTRAKSEVSLWCQNEVFTGIAS